MNLSASRIGIAQHCLYFARDDVEWPADEMSPAAEIGTWYHAVCCWTICTVLGLISETPIPLPPECMGDACELTPKQDAEALLAEYDGAMIRPEVSYVYSPVSGARMIGFNLGREYGDVAPDEIPGTADVVILTKDRAILVDWKPSPFKQDSVRDHTQLSFLALCVHLYHGVDEVEVQLRFETSDRVDKHVYDAFDLLDIKERVDAIIAQLTVDADQLPNPNPGIHCTDRYCPMRTTCPKTVEAAADVLESDVPLAVVAKGTNAIESAEQAGSLWNRAHAAQALLDSVIKAVKTYVDEHGAIPLGGGKELALVEETRESLDADSIQSLWEPVQQWVPAENFAKLIKVSVPKGHLEKEVKKSVDRGQKVQTWQAALDSLRMSGMLKSKTITIHRVRKIKEPK